MQMDNLGGLLDIRRMDRVPNAQIRVMQGGENDGCIFRCFGHIERMEDDRIAKLS